MKTDERKMTVEKKYLKSSQEFCKELEDKYGFIRDDVGYINQAMQAYAQQFIDQNIEAVADLKSRLPPPPACRGATGEG